MKIVAIIVLIIIGLSAFSKNVKLNGKKINNPFLRILVASLATVIIGAGFTIAGFIGQMLLSPIFYLFGWDWLFKINF